MATLAFYGFDMFPRLLLPIASFFVALSMFGLGVPAMAASAVNPTAGDWTTFGNGPTHSGFYPATVGEVTITESWNKTFPAAINQVAVAGGRVFVTATGTLLQYAPEMFAAALDAQTGAELWRVGLDHPVSMSAPTASGARVFFSINDFQRSRVLALNAATGELSRTFHFGTQGDNKMPPTIFEEALWIRGGYFGGMQSFNISDGTQRFLVNLNDAEDWTPTFDGNALYACIDGVFTAHNPQTGARLWRLDFRRAYEILLFAAQPVSAGTKAFTISFGRIEENAGNSVLLTAIDTVTHTVAWRAPNAYYYPGGAPIPTGFSGIPAADHDSVFAISQSAVHAFDQATGQPKRVYQAGFPLQGQPLITNDLVIVSTLWNGGLTYLFDKATGELKTTLRYGGELSFSRGVLYIATALDGIIGEGAKSRVVAYKFESGGALPLASVRNISTRLQVGPGDKMGIAGFIITGTGVKKIMLRAIGPSLDELGVVGALADPFVSLQAGERIPSSNDNWEKTDIVGTYIGSDQVAAIQASSLAPKNQSESAMIATLEPGAYTALIGGVFGSGGVGLVEVYDLDPASGANLANISTRGFIGAGEMMIAGFILGYEETRILARAISIATSFPGIGDPSLELRDRNGALVAFNDNWKDSQRFEIEATTIPPNNDKESAILQTLSPGAYTAILRGATNTASGGALVEIYNL